MKTLSAKLLSVALIGYALVVLSGCNTVEGAGKDVKKVGEVIEETADDAKN